MTATRLSFFYSHVRQSSMKELPQGFAYTPDFISTQEEQELLVHLGTLPFRPAKYYEFTAKREVVSFGFGYSFDQSALIKAPPIPEFLLPLRERIAGISHRDASRFEQVSITKYNVGTTIGWHRDAPPFGIVAGISLASSCTLRMRKQENGKWIRYNLVAEPRSLYLIMGEARYVWQHSIPAVEQLRYSITFRTLG